MFNASIDGLALWTAAGKIVDTNPALWQMYGYGEGEYSALPPGTWTVPAYSPQFFRCVAESPCSSSNTALATTTESGLLSSWATPARRDPRAASFSR